MTDSIRVAVVDDDPLMRAVLKDAFEKAPGFEHVGDASTALDGVALARTLMPDVVILDHHLVGETNAPTPMQGIESVQYLKRLPDPPLVVVYTASAAAESLARQARVDAFVMKGETPSKLVATIRHLFD